MALIGDPHHALAPIIHIAGTNGKGSTSHYIATALQLMGKRVTCYSSPHILSYTERFKVSSASQPYKLQSISKAEFEQLFQDLSSKTASCQLTEFECLTLMFFFFQQESPDYVILETGLGGRLDATNVVTPCLSVIIKLAMIIKSFWEIPCLK